MVVYVVNENKTKFYDIYLPRYWNLSIILLLLSLYSCYIESLRYKDNCCSWSWPYPSALLHDQRKTMSLVLFLHGIFY